MNRKMDLILTAGEKFTMISGDKFQGTLKQFEWTTTSYVVDTTTCQGSRFHNFRTISYIGDVSSPRPWYLTISIDYDREQVEIVRDVGCVYGFQFYSKVLKIAGNAKEIVIVTALLAVTIDVYGHVDVKETEAKQL